MKGRAILSVIIGLLVVSSCRNTSIKSEELVLAGADTSDAKATSVSEGIKEIYRNFSSPLEIANLCQVIGAPFSPGYLASSLNTDKQSTSYRKAIALGILGADLGYLNMYEKTGSSIEMVSSIKKLAEGLKAGQFFDFENIKRLSLNRSNPDSLLFLSIDSYSMIDKYLRENNRSELSSLMLTGIWIESQYFATQVMKQYPDNLLRDRIGEQKMLLGDLIRIVSIDCSQSREFEELCSYLRDISSRYDDVKLSCTEGEPVSAQKDGGLVITQTEKSIVEMTDEQLAEIIDISGIVRNKLIVNN